MTHHCIYAAPGRDAALAAATVHPGVKLKVASNGSPYLSVPHNVFPIVCGMLGDARGRVWTAPAPSLRFHDGIADIAEVRWGTPGETIFAVYGQSRRLITLTEYQRAEPEKWARQNVLMHHAPGSGKSLSSLLWALMERDGSIVVVTPACVRLSWQREVRRWTTLEPLVVYGEEPYVTDHAFEAAQSAKVARTLVACAHCGRRAEEHLMRLPRVTIIAWEILAAHVGWIAARKPSSLIYDESHTAKQRRRVAMVPAQEGDKGAKQLGDGRWVTFEPLQNTAAAAAKLSKAATRRCLTTATPVKNRRRDLWAQLDYLDPYAWGGYWDWAKRFCGAAPTGYGGAMDDSGKSNTDELRRRLDMVRSRVPVEVSHAALPKLRRDLFSIPIEEQCKSDITKAQIKAAYAQGPTVALELELMDACAKKRKAVVADIVRKVAGGGDVKIVVFTGRRVDCDSYGADLRKALSKNPEVWVRSAHGGDSEALRQQIVDEYFERKGPAVFIGTGDAFGLGINGLHDTDICYTAMLPWTPGDIIQREYRFVRQGSVRPCLMLYVIAEGTADERVVSRVIDKLPDTVMVGHNEMSDFRQTLRGSSDAQLLAGLAGAILKGGAA